MRLTKKVDLVALGAELAAAGIAHRGLGTEDDVLHTYDEKGEAVPLPEAAASVIEVHVPPVRPDPLKELEAATTVPGLKAALLKILAPRR